MEESKLTELWNVAQEEERSNEKIVKAYLSQLTDQPVNVRVSGVGAGYDVSGTVDFVGEDGKEIFGADFSWAYRQHYNWNTKTYEPAELAIDCGSTGTCTRKENPGRPYMFKMMGLLWEHEAEFTAVLDKLPHEAYRAAQNAQSEYDKEQRKIREDAEQKKEDALKAKLIPGYEFEETDKYSGTVRKYKISKITPKRVYLDYQFDQNDQEWSWEGNKLLGHYDGVRTVKRNSYIKYDQLVFALMRADDNYVRVAEYMQGDNWVSSKFVRTSSLIARD